MPISSKTCPRWYSTALTLTYSSAATSRFDRPEATRRATVISDAVRFHRAGPVRARPYLGPAAPKLALRHRPASQLRPRSGRLTLLALRSGRPARRDRTAPRTPPARRATPAGSRPATRVRPRPAAPAGRCYRAFRFQIQVQDIAARHTKLTGRH